MRYWFLIVGPIVEGCLGGMASAGAATNSYMADTTTSATRSGTMSLALGLIFTGIALGSTFGGLLIRFTHTTMSVFYAATAAHVLFGVFLWFIVPESRTRSQMKQSVLKHQEEAKQLSYASAVPVSVRIRRIFKFLDPLSIFFPELHKSNLRTRVRRRDWSLPLVALAYGSAVSVAVIIIL